MRLAGRQLRFVLGSLGGWVGVRAALVWMDSGAGAGLLASRAGHLAAQAFGAKAATFPKTAAAEPSSSASVGADRAARPSMPIAPMRAAAQATADAVPPADPAPMPLRLVAASQEDGAARRLLPEQALLTPPVPSSSRLSGNAYLFVRPGSGRASLAAGGELGGSQVAARLAYRLNAEGPVRTAVAVRAYAPLNAKGAEAAAGLDWYPVPGVPLRASVERRFDLDGKGRNAWAAYAAGGFYLEQLGGRLAIDGYGQGGVVGSQRRDLFVDAALRAGRRWQIGPATAVLGAGLWGAAQPDVSRLDIGPRLGAVLPIGLHDVTVSLEGRLRIAGHAAPGSGAALTLGYDL